MRRYSIILGGLVGILLLNGCTITSLNQWLDEDLLVIDDRLAGVWQGDTNIEEKKGIFPDKDFVIVQSVMKDPEDSEEATPQKVPTGYYTITYFNNDKLKAEATIEKPFIVPHKVTGGLYRLEDTLIAQMSGETGDQSQLLTAPLYVIYKVEHSDDELKLYELELDGFKNEDLEAEGLKFTEAEEGIGMFVSETEDLSKFLGAHYTDEGFFSEKPKMILRRIRDLSKHPEFIDTASQQVEDLVPVPE